MENSSGRPISKTQINGAQVKSVTDFWNIKEEEMRESKNLEAFPNPDKSTGLSPMARESLKGLSHREIAVFLARTMLPDGIIEMVRKASGARARGASDAPRSRKYNDVKTYLPDEVDVIVTDEEDPAEIFAEDVEEARRGCRKTDGDDLIADYPNTQFTSEDHRHLSLGEKNMMLEIVKDADSFRSLFETYMALYLSDCMVPADDFEEQWVEPDSSSLFQCRSPLVRHILPRNVARDFRKILAISSDKKEQSKMFEAFNDGINSLWRPRGHLAMGELRIPHKGYGPWVFNPRKPSQYFIRVDAIVDSNQVVGWILPRIDLYETITQQQMEEYAKQFLDSVGNPDTAMVCNSSYSSFETAEYFHEAGYKIGMAIRLNKNDPLNKMLTTDLQVGQSRTFEMKGELPHHHLNPLRITAFRQKHVTQPRPLIIVDNATTGLVEERAGKIRPNCVHFYAKTMENISRADRSILDLLSKRGNKSWNLKFLHWLITLTVHNSWRIFVEYTEKKISMREYCNILVWGLLDDEELELMMQINSARSAAPQSDAPQSDAPQSDTAQSDAPQSDTSLWKTILQFFGFHTQ